MSPALHALQALLAARDDAEGSVDPALRSRLLAGTNDDLVVLLHGLTASPPAWNVIANDLHARGATVVMLRLPLHGHADRFTTVLRGLSVELLTADLQAVLAAIEPLGKRVTLGGHSLGGTLALHAGTGWPVDRVVAVAPFLGVSRVPHELHALLVPLIAQLPNVFLWWDPVDRQHQLPAHGYPRYPLRALGVGIAIADAVYADAERLPAARAIDLVVNAGETSVSNRAVRRLAARWRRVRAPVVVHELAGLPPSHDIIEPLRPNSARARETLVQLLLGEAAREVDVTHVI